MAFQNLPIGTIIAWENLAIPSGWAVCDGLNGTPDLRDKFVQGASVDGDVRGSGGAASHSHTNPNTNTRATHNHGGGKTVGSGGPSGSVWTSTGTGLTAASDGHTHNVTIGITGADSHGHTVGNTGSASSLPKYISRVFIRRNS